MTNRGKHKIYLTGSRKWITRAVYMDVQPGNVKFFVTWYGDKIEVKRSPYGGTYFYTVEKY